MKIGDRFNLLEAVRPVGKSGRGRRLWQFQCDCGNAKITDPHAVKIGRTKSCGCFRNSTGKSSVSPGDIFGEWTVVRYVSTDKSLNARWLLKCSCGNERERLASSFKYGKSRSCGCTRTPSKEKARIDLIFKVLKRGAIRRQIPFGLGKEDIRRLAEDQHWKCARTGIPLDLAVGSGRKPFGPSIDRIDSRLGYEPNNIQLVCLLYNFCKNEYADEDVHKFAEALVAHSHTKSVRRAA